MSLDTQIHDEIDALRERAPDTQALYREVCALLFFRYGITPTANKLYQYVRKGSMSAPAVALRGFWEDLRERSRVRIEHPDLPDSLKTLAGDLVGQLWADAQTQAQTSLEVFRLEAADAVRQADVARATAEQTHTSVLDESLRLQAGLDHAIEEVRALEKNLAAERAGAEALRAQVKDAGRRHAELESALLDARRDFAAEIEKSRAALERAEARLEAAERRALLEIDRERTAGVKLQKKVAELQKSQLDALERYRAEASALQGELAGAREKLGTAEGELTSMRAYGTRLAKELEAQRSESAARETENALQGRELEQRDTRIRALERDLHQAHALAALNSSYENNRKPKISTSAIKERGRTPKTR
ncbi:MAG: DNA-binding protein [Azoarcus sp.]|nr:DNA-binding protein [Azoarcus sp.]